MSQRAYFIALDIPTDLQSDLFNIMGDVPNALWVDEADLHLTLRYLGPVDGIVLDDLRRALERVKAPAFPLRLGEIGFFPLRGEPESLWIGAEGHETLLYLRRKIDSLATRMQIKTDRRRYKPHVTLARLFDAPDARLARYAAAHSLYRPEPQLATSFSLWESQRLYSGETRYTPVQRYELDHAPA